MIKEKIFILIITILILSFSICVHELGHYMVAKHMNVLVKEFSIGFGPTIYKFQKDETNYSLKVILYGGYNKFYDDNDSDIENLNLDKTKFYQNISWNDKLFILLGGITSNLIIGFLSLFIFTKLRGEPILNDSDDREKAKTLKEKQEYIQKTVSTITYKKLGMTNSIKYTFVKCYDFIKTGFDFIKNLFTNPRKNNNECEGIVSTIKVTDTLVTTDKVFIFLLTGLINLSLAIFNILPIPPLDGGKCLIVVLDHVIGHSELLTEVITICGCCLIAAFFTLGIKNDIKNYFTHHK